MALLDLQGMEQKPSSGATTGKSGASKGCGAANGNQNRAHVPLRHSPLLEMET